MGSLIQHRAARDEGDSSWPWLRAAACHHASSPVPGLAAATAATQRGCPVPDCRDHHNTTLCPLSHLLMMASTRIWMGFWSVSRWMMSNECSTMRTCACGCAQSE